MKKNITILSTASLLKRTKNLLADEGFSVTDKNFIRIVPLVNEIIAEAISCSDEHIIFTSKNAVKAYFKNSKHAKLLPEVKRVYCLSGATKKAVEKFKNFTITATADSAGALAEKMVHSHSIFNVSFFCGSIRRNDLVQKLKENLITVKETVVYETIPTPKKIKKRYDAILFFSPSAVKSFFAVNELTGKMIFFCIGQTTANELKAFTQNQIITAYKPSQKAVAKAAIKYFKK